MPTLNRVLLIENSIFSIVHYANTGQNPYSHDILIYRVNDPYSKNSTKLVDYQIPSYLLRDTDLYMQICYLMQRILTMFLQTVDRY